MAFSITAAKGISIANRPKNVKPNINILEIDSNENNLKIINNTVTWAMVSFNGIEPRLLIDGVYYDVPFTYAIYERINFLISTVDNDAHPPYTISKANHTTPEDRFYEINRWWTYLIDGMKVRVNKINTTYEVDIDLLNNAIKRRLL